VAMGQIGAIFALEVEDRAAGTRAILDDEWLAKSLRQRLTDQTCDDIYCATGRKSDDNANLPHGIGLRTRISRHDRERGSTRCQMVAFHPDGRILLIANHDAGSLAVVALERAEVLRTVPAGVGVETLSFY
jgi:hypothetical protein